MHIGERQHSQQPTSLVDLLRLPATDELQHLGEGWGGGGVGGGGGGGRKRWLEKQRGGWGRDKITQLLLYVRMCLLQLLCIPISLVFGKPFS